MSLGSPACFHRPLMDIRTFLDNFNNLVNPHETYLCHYVERLEGDLWIPVVEFKDFLRNQGITVGLIRCHAESIFLEQMASWKLDKELCYRVTCFISYTPCEDCAYKLAAFLRENTHVDLRIFAARIYVKKLQDWKAGLRALKAAGVKMAMMTFKEFERCWESFVDHQGKLFPSWDNLYVKSEELSRRLEGILQN
ncbi:DNA dC-_dU-editing enzyme APOBEC-3G [Rousettus aegyptiacus]|uniref:DNA dC->dU-editing enzyme APOBEC-3G n=1 Tax=Rousettus aegyptiacus TaxID=9407 RepID=UPI00168D353E|nr:DNA dC->dU-editing enzyme APOBEC-3G [Rousettus aegyptiacus]